MGYFRYKYAPHNYDYKFAEKTTFNGWVNIPDSVRTARNTFRNCKDLNAPIKIGNNITTTENMFYGCNKFNQNIIIPDNVTNITHMFDGCFSLSKIQNSFSDFYNMPSLKGVFRECQKLILSKEILSDSFLASDIYCLFCNCRQLGLNLNFQPYPLIFQNVTNAHRAFQNVNFEYVQFFKSGNNFDFGKSFPNLINGSYMFFGAFGKFNNYAALTNFPKSLENMAYMFSSISNLPILYNIRLHPDTWGNVIDCTSTFAYTTFSNAFSNCGGVYIFMPSIKYLDNFMREAKIINSHFSIGAPKSISIANPIANLYRVNNCFRGVNGINGPSSISIANVANFWSADNAYADTTSTSIYVSITKRDDSLVIYLTNLFRNANFTQGISNVEIRTDYGVNMSNMFRNCKNPLGGYAWNVKINAYNITDGSFAFADMGSTNYRNTWAYISCKYGGTLNHMFYNTRNIDANIIIENPSNISLAPFNLTNMFLYHNNSFRLNICFPGSSFLAFSNNVNKLLGVSSAISLTNYQEGVIRYNTTYNIYLYNFVRPTSGV